MKRKYTFNIVLYLLKKTHVSSNLYCSRVNCNLKTCVSVCVFVCRSRYISRAVSPKSELISSVNLQKETCLSLSSTIRSQRQDPWECRKNAYIPNLEIIELSRKQFLGGRY